MSGNSHDSIRLLIDQSLAGAASSAEEQRLRGHLDDCAECREYAEAGRRAIAGLGGFSFAVDAGLEEKVFAALDLRARQLEATQISRGRLLRSCFVALLLTVVGSLIALAMGGPLAAALDLDHAQAQAGVLALWVLPSCCFALVFPAMLLFRASSAKGSEL